MHSKTKDETLKRKRQDDDEGAVDGEEPTRLQLSGEADTKRKRDGDEADKP